MESQEEECITIGFCLDTIQSTDDICWISFNVECQEEKEYLLKTFKLIASYAIIEFQGPLGYEILAFTINFDRLTTLE